MTSRGTVSSKGQVTLPAWARERLGLRAGAKVRFRIDGDALVLERVDRTLDELQGALSDLYAGAGGVEAVVAELQEGRADRPVG